MIEDSINLLIEIQSFKVQLKKTNFNNTKEINVFDLFKENINCLLDQKNKEISLFVKENKELEEKKNKK